MIKVLHRAVGLGVLCVVWGGAVVMLVAIQAQSRRPHGRRL